MAGAAMVPSKTMTRPLMVAIGGDSGTGKAAVSAGLRELLGEARCSEVRLDGYFALSRIQRNTVGLSPLDPRTHDFAAMDEDLLRLAEGGTVVKRVYDHVMGAFAGSESIEPREIVLVQGRLPLHTRVLRELFGVRVWLEREPNLTLPWTIHRDAVVRGDGDERVREAIERRRADYEMYIAPQARYAEICVRFAASGATFEEDGHSVVPDATTTRSDLDPTLARTVALIAKRIERARSAALSTEAPR